MKQHNIFGGLDLIIEDHPQFEDKKINNNYYGSDLNKFIAESGRKDMVVNNIDLIINDYKRKRIKIIESKHLKEKLSKGQELLLQELSNKGIDTYVVYGDYPYNQNKIYSFQSNTYKEMNQEELLYFINHG